MPDYSSKLKFPMPLGTDTVNRTSYRETLNKIDENAALDPFILKQAVYDSENSKIVVTIGRGQAAFLDTLVAKSDDSEVDIASPAINTDYYVYLNDDGTFSVNTTGGAVSGAVCLHKVSTGASVETITSTDQRGLLPGASARSVKDELDTHKADEVNQQFLSVRGVRYNG